jgi:DNA modification methylase
VKSVALMRWLLRLVTKPGDVILDPFGGSGTTGVAALLEGRRVILVEREPQYAAIARARIAAAEATLPAQLDLLAATGA